MDKPKVSVIIPIFNTEKYLPECVESVMNQTLKDIEIILVDDGSPDNSPKLCDEYAKLDNRIRVIHKENAGAGFARNSGLNIAEGEYVSFIDSDDFIAPDMLQSLYDVAVKYDADDVRGGTVFFYEDGKSKDRPEVENIEVFRGEAKVTSFILDMLGPKPEEPHDVKYLRSTCIGIHRRKVIEDYKIRFLSEKEILSEDLIFLLDYLSKVNCIVCMPDCYYTYRMNPDSFSHMLPPDRYYKIKVFLKYLNNRFRNQYDNDNFLLRYYRLEFLYIRIYIKRISKSHLPFKKKYEQIKNVLDDGMWNSLFSSYPYERMDIKHRLYFYLLKYRLIIPLIIIKR